MTLPQLYVEGLTQHALRGQEQLNTYKLGVIEAILKAALRGGEDDMSILRSGLQAALAVARWELRPGRSPDTSKL